MAPSRRVDREGAAMIIRLWRGWTEPRQRRRLPASARRDHRARHHCPRHSRPAGRRHPPALRPVRDRGGVRHPDDVRRLDGGGGVRRGRIRPPPSCHPRPSACSRVSTRIPGTSRWSPTTHPTPDVDARDRCRLLSRDSTPTDSNLGESGVVAPSVSPRFPPRHRATAGGGSHPPSENLQPWSAERDDGVSGRVTR